MVNDAVNMALEALRTGSFVLMHDSESRENEVDMVAAAEFVTPAHISKVRAEAGGLVCLALSWEMGQSIGLPYAAELLRATASKYEHLGGLVEDSMPYGGQPAFSITINHRRTFTGVTDRDRAITISELAKLCKSVDRSDIRRQFLATFRSPGHVHLLLASDGLLDRRRGHTELSICLARLASLTPVMLVCEMLDGSSYGALSMEQAFRIARKRHYPLLEGSQIVEHFERKFKRLR